MTKVNCALPEGSNLQGWILSIASGLACCVGVASLALGAGVMLYSSFYTLMHESKTNFEHSDLSKGYSGLFLLIFYFADQDQKQLMRIGIQTALAISIHKFPEGLITFVTSKVSPSMGFALFFAIALHNISEGFAIALPLYIATRSRMKSFLYTTLLGGLSQPLGALIGWFFLKKSSNECWDHNFVYGALFGFVSGLMAIKNDRSNGNLVSTFFFLGVIIMGLSSALFDHAKSSN
ncbi:10000_t:CDS:2 [Diversispora eburnea]|uniref:10000_t:CDS:1 n=1 Tax=Diversispora eburnea TaxID=1213867 RepID=A0A9N8Z0Y4_9GLOM|nr:10000_t:CDS:2 [Diversispora eburnea]